MRDRYVRASELKSFAFCQRAWFLERQGTESALASERERGRADHVSHGGAVRQATAGIRAATILFMLGLVGIAAAALHWWISR